MNPQSTPSHEKQLRDAAYWAQYTATLKVARAPTGALNLNVEGRRAMSPLQGFGQMWQKTFRIRMNSTGHFSRVFTSRIDGANRSFLAYSTHKGCPNLGST